MVSMAGTNAATGAGSVMMRDELRPQYHHSRPIRPRQQTHHHCNETYMGLLAS